MPTIPAEDLLRRSLRGGRLLRALADLRTRHPDASFEVGAVELAIADAAREIEAYLAAVHADRGGASPDRGGTSARS